MTAAGIRPTVCEVILACGSPLQQQFAILIGYQNEKRAVQLPFAMRGELAARFGGLVPETSLSADVLSEQLISGTLTASGSRLAALGAADVLVDQIGRASGRERV